MTKKSKFFAELKKENNIKKFNVKEIKLNRIQDIKDLLRFESEMSDAKGLLDDIEALSDNFYGAYKNLEEMIATAEEELMELAMELEAIGVDRPSELEELRDTIDRQYDELFELEDRARFYNIVLN
tara:strand:+ start:16 stop:393 length:378 start_codon:yes stop_codon:yes gene_type:complete